MATNLRITANPNNALPPQKGLALGNEIVHKRSDRDLQLFRDKFWGRL